MKNDLAGLVLMGGRSQRMGKDKSQIIYHNKKLYEIAAEKLKTITPHVYLSVNKEQTQQYTFNWPTITDQWEEEGPLSGLISAFEALKKPIFIFACDMPNMDTINLSLLANEYYKAQKSIMFFNALDHRVEPLASIWSTEDLIELKKYFINGGRSFKGFIESFKILTLATNNTILFKNLNRPDDL